MTILFIEDHAAVMEHPRMRLAQAFPQHRVVWARSGAEGLALARADAPQVVVLDLALPDGDGFDLIAPLRARERPPAIIIFTGRGDEATRVRALAAPGFAGLLWKGTDGGDQVAAAVGAALAGGRYISDHFARSQATGLTAPQASSRRERIVVVKGNWLLAEGIARAAREACPEREVAVCTTAAAAEAHLRAGPVALGVVGLNLADRDGLDFLMEAERERWFARTLVVSARDDERTRSVLRALRIDGVFACGAEDPARLAPAIRRVAEGGTYCDERGHKTPPEPPGAGTGLSQLLTETELLVFAVVGGGADDSQANERLGMGAATAHSHRQNIMYKLGVQSRVDLMRAAIGLGVVRFTEAGKVLTPGLERALAARLARSRDPFGRKDDGKR